MSIPDIVGVVVTHPADFVVLTGGEPMIAKDIHKLAASLKEAGKHITIETAATVPPAGIACDLASLSPKMGNSTPTLEQAGPWLERHEQTRQRPDVIAEWIQAYPYQLKFVVSTATDLMEVQARFCSCLRESPPLKSLAGPRGSLTSAKLTATAIVPASTSIFSETPRAPDQLYAFSNLQNV